MIPGKLTITDFKAVAQQYARDNITGGCLHILTDDGNIRKSDARSCYWQGVWKGDHYGAALALLLTQMTTTQRGRVSKRWYDWASE